MSESVVDYRSSMELESSIRLGFIAEGTGAASFLYGIVSNFLSAVLIGLGIPVVIMRKATTKPILPCSLMCKANANLAVTLQATMLSALSVTTYSSKVKGILYLADAGFAAALFSSVAFYHLALRLAPFPYLLSFRGHGGFVHFLIREGVPWAGFSAFFFPVGVLAGKRLQGLLPEIRLSSPRQFYGGASAFIVTGLLMIAATFLYWR